jgi:hypothetical protein
LPDFDVDSLLRLAPTTNVDGYDLTVAEARAMPRELFARAFDFASLDEVPVVAPGLSGPGIFDEAPAEADWYVWRRPPPDQAKKPRKKVCAKARSKARKKAAFLLVRRIPKHERAAAGGGDRVFRTLRAKDVDAARLEVLVEGARAQNRRIHAATWPIERIVSLSARDVLEVYLVRNNLRGRSDGKESGRRKKSTRQNIVRAVETFQREFPMLRIGDLEGEWIADEYETRTGCRPTTRYADLKSVKKGLRGGLALLGIRDHRIGFDNPDPGRVTKMPWTPWEHDCVVAAAHGLKTLPDGTRIPGGSDYRGQWQRGIPFLSRTATRHGILPNVRWLPPWVEPSDGLPLAMCDRAWIEVTDGPIYFHRDGGMPYDSNKGRAGNVIPDELAPDVRAWFEADMRAGHEFVFRRKNGMRYVGRHIGWWTFRRIVADAGMSWERVPHHFKDFAKEIAEASGLRVESFAAHADTSVEVLEGTYGNAERAALLLEAAQKMSLAAWREKAAPRADIVERFRRGRAEAEARAAEEKAGAKTARPRTAAEKNRRLETDGKRRAEAAKIRAEAGKTRIPAGPAPSARPARRDSAAASFAGDRPAARRAGSRKPG